MLMPPRIEADALANDRKPPSEDVLGAGRSGSKDDHPGRVVAPLPDRQEHPHAEFRGFVRADDVDREAVAVGDRAGLAGQDFGRNVVGGAVVEDAGQVRPLAHDDAALCGSRESGGIRARCDQNQLGELGRNRFDVVAVERGRFEAAFDDAACEQLGDHFDATLDPRTQIADPDGQPSHGAAGQAPLDGGTDADDRLAGDGLGLPGRYGQQPARLDFAGRGHDGAIPLAPELSERNQRRQLASGSLVQLGQRPLERWLAHERDGDHVSRDVPRLIADDSQLHDLWPSGLRAAHRGAADPWRRRIHPGTWQWDKSIGSGRGR